MISKLIKREKYIILNGQTRRFRMVKWIILILLSAVVLIWKGIGVVIWLWLFIAIVGISLHFFLRYKTNGWRSPWGPYKEPIKTPFDD